MWSLTIATIASLSIFEEYDKWLVWGQGKWYELDNPQTTPTTVKSLIWILFKLSIPLNNIWPSTKIDVSLTISAGTNWRVKSLWDPSNWALKFHCK